MLRQNVIEKDLTAPLGINLVFNHLVNYSLEIACVCPHLPGSSIVIISCQYAHMVLVSSMLMELLHLPGVRQLYVWIMYLSVNWSVRDILHMVV